jgi:hypothetical protein
MTISAADRRVSKRIWRINTELHELAGRTENRVVKTKINTAVRLLGEAWASIAGGPLIPKKRKRPRSKPYRNGFKRLW